MIFLVVLAVGRARAGAGAVAATTGPDATLRALGTGASATPGAGGALDDTLDEEDDEDEEEEEEDEDDEGPEELLLDARGAALTGARALRTGAWFLSRLAPSATATCAILEPGRRRAIGTAAPPAPTASRWCRSKAAASCSAAACSCQAWSLVTSASTLASSASRLASTARACASSTCSTSSAAWAIWTTRRCSALATAAAACLSRAIWAWTAARGGRPTPASGAASLSTSMAPSSPPGARWSRTYESESEPMSELDSGSAMCSCVADQPPPLFRLGACVARSLFFIPPTLSWRIFHLCTPNSHFVGTRSHKTPNLFFCLGVARGIPQPHPRW